MHRDISGFASPATHLGLAHSWSSAIWVCSMWINSPAQASGHSTRIAGGGDTGKSVLNSAGSQTPLILLQFCSARDQTQSFTRVCMHEPNHGAPQFSTPTLCCRSQRSGKVSQPVLGLGQDREAKQEATGIKDRRFQKYNLQDTTD